MPRTKPQSEQIRNISAKVELGTAADAALDTIIDSISSTLRTPLRLYASATPDALLNIAASQVQVGNSTGKTIGPVGGSTPSFAATTINFQTGAVTGGTVNGSLPSTTVGQFRRAAFTIKSDSTIDMTFSAAAVTVGALADPATLFTAGGSPIGWIDLEATAATAFKTAGSSTSVVENAVGGTSRIVNMGASGGGGSSTDLYERKGRAPIGAGVTFVDITFAAVPTANGYSPVCSWIYTGVGSPQFQPYVISNLTTTGFRVSWNAVTDEATYEMSYQTKGL